MPPDEEDLHGHSYDHQHDHRVFPHEEEMNDLNLIDPLRRPTKGLKLGLRARSYHRHILSDPSKVWHKRVRMAASFGNILRMVLLLILLIAIAVACFTLPIDKILNGFLIWIHINLGSWGPVALALAYIPLTILAVPASILTIGGGYLFGLPIGFLADSAGAALGATAAFLVGRTIARPLVLAKLKDYPQFQVISLAVKRSGFKIILLLRLVPLLPFNIMNYLLSVTPIGVGKYMLASWIGMMPITGALVYLGTTIKDLSDITHDWGHFTTFEWMLLAMGLIISVVVIVLVSRIARKSLNKAILEIEAERTSALQSENVDGASIYQPLIIQIDGSDHSDSKKNQHSLSD